MNSLPCTIISTMATITIRKINNTLYTSRKFCGWIFAILLLISCGRDGGSEEVKRSAYYWSTTFRMDSTKLNFIRDHGIQRLYVRYFDVVTDATEGAKPNATILFQDSLPEGVEIVPVVYILNECMTAGTEGLAEKIAKRVLQMNETHDVIGVKEVQIDCDWTLRTEKRFFSFLTEIRKILAEHDIQLSVTIRLHQLSGNVPPVDRGVLMMYNTGDFTDINCEKPILDIETAEPYLRYLEAYKLPLATAYPLYRWNIVFRGSHYIGIMHGEDDLPTLSGDSIVVREPALDEVLEARKRIGALRPDANDETILYELNDYNITRFNQNDYEKIFAR